jgi:putative resolvase
MRRGQATATARFCRPPAVAGIGRRLAVIDGSEVTDDLAGDVIEVLTSFCARLYGGRSLAGPSTRRSGTRRSAGTPASCGLS